MDADIQFGELEEAGREVRLRPDRNRHYAVVPVHQPEDVDLPIFVDVDVMRDMEFHALTDTSVELGGVMLGGQYEDENGEPFVLVTDSLRAEHYEATKGSFKFTHETWARISRQREEFPEDLQMVGWYHTHPDWGVFLSGMDMFICENFFNRPLDLALVIDPCRGDRGWFQWTDPSSTKIRRTGGFYLVGSRFRQAELEYFAFQLKGKFDMAAEYRNQGMGGSLGPSLPPVVNISDSGNASTQFGIFGLLTLQFLFLAVLSWKLLFGGDSQSASELQQQLAALSEQKISEQRVKILEKALTLSGDKSELVSLLEENQNLKIQLEDSTAKRQLLNSENQSLEAKARMVGLENSDLQKELERKKDEVSGLKSQLRDVKSREPTEEKSIWENSTLVLFVAATGFICALGGALVGFLLGRSRGDEDDFDAVQPFQIDEESEDARKDPGASDELMDRPGSQPRPE